jgi:hypothetical protein
MEPRELGKTKGDRVMALIQLNLSEEKLVAFIKDLLCCPNLWKRSSMTERFEIKIKADKNKVQGEILSWLSIPERLWNITEAHIEEKEEGR